MISQVSNLILGRLMIVLADSEFQQVPKNGEPVFFPEFPYGLGPGSQTHSDFSLLASESWLGLQQSLRHNICTVVVILKSVTPGVLSDHRIPRVGFQI